MCPECQSGNAHTLDTDRYHTDEVVRLRQCKDCGLEYTTFEVAVPVSFYRVAIRRKDTALRYHRKRDGYTGQKTRPPVEAPRVDIRVRVHE